VHFREASAPIQHSGVGVKSEPYLGRFGSQLIQIVAQRSSTHGVGIYIKLDLCSADNSLEDKLGRVVIHFRGYSKFFTALSINNRALRRKLWI
jgi:hypothetical protein